MREKDRFLRIFIVGFMGAGKTSVGESLARELGWRFVDLDHEIEREVGRSIPEIFRESGEPAFRRIESRVLRAAGAGSHVVIACGGGTLTVRENHDLIWRTGVSVWLEAPLDVMMERCRGGEHRPLMADRPRMEALLESRLPDYQKADLRVNAAVDPPDQIALRLVGLLAGLR